MRPAARAGPEEEFTTAGPPRNAGQVPGIGAGAGGLVHAAGSPGSAAPLSAYLPGAGGGGGGTSNTAATRGGVGGLGGNYGGGGGGGGAGDANANAVGAGAGGNGANGCVIIVTYF